MNRIALDKFCNWLERWAAVVSLLDEHRSLSIRPLLNETRLREIERRVGALVVTALGPHGNSRLYQ